MFYLLAVLLSMFIMVRKLSVDAGVQLQYREISEYYGRVYDGLEKNTVYPEDIS